MQVRSINQSDHSRPNVTVLANRVKRWFFVEVQCFRHGISATELAHNCWCGDTHKVFEVRQVSIDASSIE